MRNSAINRFNDKWELSKDSLHGGEPCWIWTAGRDVEGYARFSCESRTIRGHRWSYEHFVGPIGKGLEIDHLCEVKSCVNPAHLEAVPKKVNINRGKAAEYHTSKTHCKYGHPFDDENTYYRKNGNRTCRACNRVRTSKGYVNPDPVGTETHCKRGHERNEDNTYINPNSGTKRCRPCGMGEKQKRRKAAVK